MLGVNVAVYAQVADNAPQLLGRATLQNRDTGVRDVAKLMREVADALDAEATFHELVQGFDVEGGG